MLICVQFSGIGHGTWYQYEDALRGYDLPRGDPDMVGDPGIKALIFKKYGRTKNGSLQTPPELEHNPEKDCEEQKATQIFRKFTDFYSQQMKSTQTSESLQVGTEMDVKVKAEYGGVGGELGFSTPPLYGSSDGNKDREKTVKRFVVDQRGGFTLVYKKCLRIIHSMFLSNLPPFSEHFLKALSEVSKKVHSTDIDQVYMGFVESFGTHYSRTTLLGAVAKAYTFFSESDRSSMTDKEIFTASESSSQVGLWIFGKTTSQESSANFGQNRSIERLSERSFVVLTRTHGTVTSTKPDDWVKQVMDGASFPFGRDLVPIHSIFAGKPYEKLKKQAKDAGITIHATAEAMQLFFVMQYRRYCIIFRVSF